MSLLLKVETIASSDPPEHAITALAELSKRIGIEVECVVNGQKYMAHPTGYVSKIIKLELRPVEVGCFHALRDLNHNLQVFHGDEPLPCLTLGDVPIHTATAICHVLHKAWHHNL